MSVRHVHTNAVPDGTATSVVRPSDWNSAHAQFMTLLGNTAGASTLSGTNLQIAGGNGVTLSANGQTLSIHGATDYLSSGQSTAFAPAAHTHAHSALTGLDDDQHPRLTNFMSTTLLVGGEVTINVGDPTLFDIAAGVGIVVDNYTDPENPTRTIVSWAAQIGNATPFLASNPSSAVGIDISGNVVVVIDQFDDPQRRDIIACGSVTHVNGIEIEFTDNYPVFNLDPANQLMDFVLNFGAFNVTGTEYSAAAADLTVARTAGKTFIAGGNYATSRKSPNVCVTASESPVADLYYYHRNIGGDWVNTNPPVADVDPNNWDTGTGIAAVPASEFTIQTIFFYGPYASTDVQYGQVLYATMADAEAALQDAIALNPWVATWDTFRAWLIVQEGCTDLSNPGMAKFVSAGKLGLISVAAGGGAGGEINTASNVGNAGVGPFLQKTGVDLEFKNIASASPRVSVSNDTAGSNIRIDVVESAVNHNALSNLLVGNPHTQYASNNHSHGNPTLNLTNLSGTTDSNSAGFTLSLSAAAQTNQTVGLYALGNTTGQSSSSTRDARSISFEGAGIVSVGLSNSSYRISATQSNQAFSAAGGSSAFQTLSFNNANGFTFSNVGGAIQGSYTVPTQSAQTMGLYASSNTTGQSSSTTVDARTLSVRGAGVASVGYSNGELIISVPAGGGGGDGINALAVNGGASTASTTLTLSNSNNVSFGLAAGVITASASFAQSVQTQNMVSVQGSTGAISFGNANGITFGFNASTVTASHNGLTSQSNQAVSGQNGSSTFQTLSFANSNGISFGTAGGGLTASHNALTTAALSDHSHGNPQLNLTNLSGTTASNSAGFTLSLSAAAGGGGGITNINVSAGTTSQNLSNIVFSDSNGVSFGLNGSTLTASVAAGGGGGGTVNKWEPLGPLGFFTTAATMGNGTIFIAPAPLFGNFSGSRADILASISLSSSSNSSHAGDISLYMGVYTRNGSTLSLATSASQSHRWTNTSNNSLSLVSGFRRLTCPLGVNMTPGDYWIAVMTRTSTTNANWFSASLARLSGMTNQIHGLIGESSNSTRQRMLGWGTFSTTSSVLPGSIAFTAIRGQGMGSSNAVLPPYVHFGNFTV